jgi:hypothetical protein
MALVSTQLLTEMSTRKLPGSKGRLAREFDNLIAICELSKNCGRLDVSQHYGPPRAVKGYLGAWVWQFQRHLWADCLEKMWEPRRLTTLWASTACYIYVLKSQLNIGTRVNIRDSNELHCNALPSPNAGFCFSELAPLIFHWSPPPYTLLAVEIMQTASCQGCQRGMWEGEKEKHIKIVRQLGGIRKARKCLCAPPRHQFSPFTLTLLNLKLPLRSNCTTDEVPDGQYST